MLDRFSIGRVAVVPKLLSRPVAASAVADCLARIAVAPQPPARIEIAGPECLCLPEMSRRLCRYQRDRMLLIPIRVPGKAGRAIAHAAPLPNGHFEMDQQTFKDWLESQPRRRRRRHPSRRTNRPSRPASTTAVTT